MKSKMWGGRFNKKTDHLVEEFTKSIQFDKKLAEYDCIGSIAHIGILKKAGLLSADEHKKLESGLKEILISIQKGNFKVDESFEDIHSYIQYLLEKKAGPAALKLHTCRSRNDQVVFDTKYYCKCNLIHTEKLLIELTTKIGKLAAGNRDIILPGYTHLQHAMPISLESCLSAYCNMLGRDEGRLSNANDNIQLTLGAGALAGTMIDSSKYNIVVKSLFIGKDDAVIMPTANPIDSVSDRDFIIETLSALAIIGMHLSRLAEDLILWSTKEFDFVDIDDAFCTGSSLMPQKKNPDVLELIRGNTGKLYGNLMSVLVMMKGLPLSYNRDMQLDKEPLFESFEIVQKELGILTKLLPQIKFKKENIDKQLEDECLYATDMADYLVQNKIPFKDAHNIIGRLISYKLEENKKIMDMTKEELSRFHPLLTPGVMKKIINPENSVRSKKSIKRTATG